MVVAESEDGHVIDPEGTVIGNLNVNIDSDSNNDDTGEFNNGRQAAIVDDFGGSDTGPAPLQNDVIPDETFEGVVNVIDQTETGGGNANMINAHVHNVVAQLRSYVHYETVQDIAQEPEPHQITQPPLPQPRFNADQTEARYDHSELLPVNGFVNMNTQKYAWALAFPTLFIPSFVPVDDHMKWRIFHDITGWEGPREKPVKKNIWYEHLMWRSDGRPAAHPTFSLVLYNYKVKNYLQRQGQFLINISDFDPGTTVEDIRAANNDNAIRDQTIKLLERAIVYSGNAPGTPEYWKATYHEFVAANFTRSFCLTKISTCSLPEVWRNFMNNLCACFCQNILLCCHLSQLTLILTQFSMMTQCLTLQYRGTKT
jgi:hypothetical protein